VELQRCTEVLRVVRAHAAQQADVIGDAGEVGHQIRDDHA
jgi:hypothetical protein